jgi:methionyl-tRNA formyltransferase
MTTLRIVFAGTPEFGIPCLDALHTAHHELIALYTQPDRPAGRGQKMNYSAVKTWGLSHHLPIYQPVNFKSSESVAELTALAPDLIVVIAYGLILPKSVLAIPRLGCINVHASLLPRWRGASPIQQALLAGDTETGVTIMQMDVGMDTGDYLVQSTCAINATDTSASLHQRLSLLAPEPLLRTIDLLANGQAIPTKQAEEGVTYAPKIQKQDAAIQWSQAANLLDRQIRGYSPWPVAYTQLDDINIRIYQAHAIDQISHQPPGTILDVSPKGLLVNTGQGVLCITSLQFPGGKPISLRDYINARRQELCVGNILQ